MLKFDVTPLAMQPLKQVLLSLRVKQVEDCLNDILGEPTLDGLMVVMTAIGASKISLNLSEDGDQLSFSGIISLTSEDKKIRKE